MKPGKRHSLSRVWYGILALHFLFVFCAIDLFHADTCLIQTRNPNVPVQTNSDEGCPACMFKAGAYAEQPEVIAVSGSIQPIFWCCCTPIETIEGNEPACCLYLRGPPAV